MSWERSGSVVECLTQDPGAADSGLMGVTALFPCAKHINPSFVLVQLRKTRPSITERLLMGCKESNQIKKKMSFVLWSVEMCQQHHLQTVLTHISKGAV